MDFLPILRAFALFYRQSTRYRQAKNLCLLYLGKKDKKIFLKNFKDKM